MKKAFRRLLDAVDQSVAAAVPVGPGMAEASCGPLAPGRDIEPCARVVAYAWGRAEGDLRVVISPLRLSPPGEGVAA